MITLHINFRYALVNLCLIIGALKEIRSMLLVWIAFTVGFLALSFTLVSVMFSYDTTPNFVGGVAIAQLSNFAILARFDQLLVDNEQLIKACIK